MSFLFVRTRGACRSAVTLFCLGVLLPATSTGAAEMSGYVAVEGQLFAHEPLHAGQDRDNVSLALQPEWYHEWRNSGAAFTLTPFVRVDSADGERTHYDIRELNFLWAADQWELRVGIGRVFWGATEFVHLVDILNQSDLVESIDEEEKLGQPMVHLSLPRDWGVVDLFVLPYFRERTFPGTRGRLRSAVVVDTDRARFESGAKRFHTDAAIRYSHAVGDVDVGIYHFYGTGREPTLLLDADSRGSPSLIPFYELIQQTGMDLQVVFGSWLVKLESLYRSGQGDGFFAGVGGFEYSIFGVAESDVDLGLLGEWAYDDRGVHATSVLDDDIMLGVRLAFNDAEGSELLAGLIRDLHSAAQALSLEGRRRIGDRCSLLLELRAFLDIPEDDLLYGLRADDFLRLTLEYYF